MIQLLSNRSALGAERHVVDVFLHARLRADPEMRHRARLFVLVLLFAAVAVNATILLRVLGGNTGTIGIRLLFGVSFLPCLLLTRWHGSLPVAKDAAAVAIFAAVTALCVLSGGARSKALYIYVIFPFVAGIFASAGRATFWTVVALGAMLAMYVLDAYGVILPPTIIDHVQHVDGLTLTLVCCSLVGISLLFSRGRRRLRDALRDSTEALATANRSLELVGRQMRSADQAKEAFLTQMSGELRGVLRTVAGSAAAIETRLRGAPIHNQSMMLRKSSERLVDMVDGVVDFAQGNDDQQQGRTETFSLTAEVAAVVERHRADAADRGIDIRATVDPDLADLRRGARESVRRIMFGLIENAVKFTDRGEVTLSVTDAPGHRVRFVVQDSGIGIPAELHDRIFEPFVVLDDSSTRRHRGTGLGLPLCRRMVERLGGELQVESGGDEKGSTFSFEIPLPVVVRPSEVVG